MLAGFSGHLISELFLEHLSSEDSASGHEELARLRRSLDRWRRTCGALGPATPPRAVHEAAAEPLARALGFSSSGSPSPLNDAVVTTISAGGARVSLLTTCWGESLDRLWRPAVEHAARTGAAWCLLFNGTHLRLIEAQRLYARRHVEFDVDLAIEDANAFRALALVMSARAIAAGAESSRSALHAIIDQSDRHAAAVCISLRSGVLDASTQLFQALMGVRGARNAAAAFEQALTIVYRVLFLLFAEARHLVPLWHPVYRGSYSMEALCDVAERGRTSAGLWEAIRAASRLAHAGCRIGDLHVTAFNGRLFAPGRTPLVERRGLDDDAAKRALLAISTQPATDGQGRERIAYRDLGVEELGGVYESLLDYQPTKDRTLQPGSGQRKATGSFYTPRTIAEYLVRRTLAPLVRDAAPERILSLRVLDPSMGSGAFLVAACAFLAQAYEGALIAAGGYHATDFGPRERVAVRRTIAERCLFGVDVNPMAVQLARLSLWLATLAADRPLTFLDHHLVAGDSILGAWLSALGRAPVGTRIGRDDATLPLFDADALAAGMRGAVPLRFNLAELPNDTPEQVRDKERQLSALGQPGSPLARWKRVADLWCAYWFWGEGRPPASAFRALSDSIVGAASALPEPVASRYSAMADRIALARKFFHWELEFPEVFFDAGGCRRADAGFDAIVGNPPWDMVRGDSVDAPHRGAARDEARAVLRFTRDSGIYSCQSDGHANRYQLFVERSIALAAPGGRIGLVLPSGLASDHGSARLRRHLFSQCAVDGIIGFENSARIFPIHRSVRFQLITATSGRPTREFGCRLGDKDPRVLNADVENSAAAWFPVRLTPDLLERVSGAGMAVPDFRCATDVAIAERAARLFRRLGDTAGWCARFGRELNATDDGEHLHAGAAGFPVVGGRTIAPYRVSLSSALPRISPAVAHRLLGNRCLRARLAYRDVASATNRVTLIAAMLPPRTASTHTVFCLRTPLASRAQHFLCGLFNSLVVNFLVRLRVTTHVTTAIVEHLPVPAEHDCPAAFAEVAAAARLLARHDDVQLRAAVDARVAGMYRLSRDEFARVLDTFPLIPRTERDRALAAFTATSV